MTTEWCLCYLESLDETELDGKTLNAFKEEGKELEEKYEDKDKEDRELEDKVGGQRVGGQNVGGQGVGQKAGGQIVGQDQMEDKYKQEKE